MTRFGRAVVARLFAALFVVAILPLYGQQYSQVSGLIVDPTQAGVPGAIVTVVSEDTGFRRTARSEDGGTWAVGSLQPGHYRITVRKQGFRTMIRQGVKLDTATRARVDFQLSVGSVQESITVSGAPVEMNTEDASVGTLVGKEWIERLPLNGRGLLGLLELSPGAVATPATRGDAGQFTVNGQRPNSHYFTVDGLSVNSGVSGGGLPAQSSGGSLPGMTAFGSFHNLVSVEALDEFRMQTSTVVPEYGRLPGAHVALSTRSGTNQFHGSAYGYLRNEKFDANDWFANRFGLGQRPARVHHGGAALGGPIKRNRAFFFANWEKIRLRQPQVWRAPVPSMEARSTAPEWAAPLLNMFPEPTGGELGSGLAEWTGYADRPSRLDAASLRLDAAITSRLTFFGRYNHTPSRSTFGGFHVNRLAIRSYNLSGGLTANLGAGFVQDFRAGLSDAAGNAVWRPSRAETLPECYLADLPQTATRTTSDCTASYQYSIAGLGQIFSGSDGDIRQRQWHFLETVALNRGNHQMRFGADYRRIAPARRRPDARVSVMAESLPDMLARRGVWVISTPGRSRSILLEEISLFAQDTWRITPALTVTYGMRWELNPPPVSKDFVNGIDTPGSTPFNPASDIPIWQMSYRNLAPRVGVAWRLRRDGGTVLRAGFGIYYDSSMASATDLVNDGPFNVWDTGTGTTTGPVRTLFQFGFAPDLRLPVTRQWNVSLEHMLSPGQTVSAGYVGSAGRHLLRREVGGPRDAVVRIAMTTNHADSDYHGLQLQYRRRLRRNVQTLASYTWSHSIDTAASDAGMYWAGTGYQPRQDRGSSDFDVRQSLNVAFTYETGAPGSRKVHERLWRGWSADGIFRARTGFPIAVLNAEHAMGVSFSNVFRPDLVWGAPVWIADAAAPGGRALNRAAFRGGNGVEQGTLGRNAIGGFGMSQIDVALRRRFEMGDRLRLETRIEGFNVLNRANMADPVRFLSNPLFGQPASMLNLMLGSGSPATGLSPMLQSGGARSVQLALRFQF